MMKLDRNKCHVKNRYEVLKDNKVVKLLYTFGGAKKVAKKHDAVIRHYKKYIPIDKSKRNKNTNLEVVEMGIYRVL